MAGGARTSSRTKIALIAALIAIALVVGSSVWYFATHDLSATAPAAAKQTQDGGSASGQSETAKPPADEIERSAAIDQRAVDEAPRPNGDLFALLEWLEHAGHGPLPDVVGDAAGFERLFASQNLERWIEIRAPSHDIGGLWTAGAVISLPPGVWQLDQVLPPSGALPPDVTLAGGGVTRTLLLVGGVKPAARVERLTLRDCTVFTDNQPLIELPRELAAITLERIRLVGFDSGQVHSPLIRARGLGIQMRDCELLGGYGRAPGSGSLFDVPSAALLARLERCRFDAVRLGLDTWKGGVSVAFVAGTTSTLVEDPSPALAAHPGVSFVDTPLALLPSGQRPQALELDALFTGWRKQLK